MEDWVSKLQSICDLIHLIQTNSATTKIHKCKSTTLATRVNQLLQALKTRDLTQFNINSMQVKGSMSMLLVCLEEVNDYFRLLQSKDKALEKRIKRFGSDEETFAKWNLTLQTCYDGLGIEPDKGLFDEKKDEEDFVQDMEHLNRILELIFLSSGTESRLGDEGFTIAGIQKMLTLQEGDRGQARTLQEVKRDKEFDIKAIRYEKVIGKGGFGIVWQAKYKGERLAIKTVPSDSLTEKATASLKLEAEFMKKLSHPRIVACLGVVQYRDKYCMIMELCVNGSLSAYLSEKAAGSVTWEQRVEFSTDVAAGMNYLHKLGVIHRDLKPGNVVLDQYYRAKITDFGLSVVKSESQTSIKLKECGTPQYMAPESFGLVPMFSTKSDVYAFAIILWELSHWTTAYSSVSPLEIRDSIRDGERLPISVDVPKGMKKLITSCWNQNPRHRPDFKGIIDSLATLDGFAETVTIAEKSFTPKSDRELVKSLDKRVYIFGRKVKRKVLCGVLILLLLLAGAISGIIYAVAPLQLKSDNFIPNTAITNSTLISSFLTDQLAQITDTMRTSSVAQNAPITHTTRTGQNAPTTQIVSETQTIETTQTTPISQTIKTTQAPETTHITPTTTTDVTSTSTPCMPTIIPTVVTFRQDAQLLNHISGLVIDSNDTLYTYSTGSQRVLKLSITGDNTPIVIANITGTVQNPVRGKLCYQNNSIYIPAAGLIYQVDLLNNSYISRFAGTGTYGKAVDGPKSTASFVYASVCVFDQNGNMYVGDSNLIRIIYPGGSVSTVPSFQATTASALMFDNQQRLLVIDYFNNQIYRFNVTDWSYQIIAGNGLTLHQDGQGIDSQFDTGEGLAQDKYGNVFFTESNGQSINMINATGYVSRISGDGTAGFTSPTRYKTPKSLAFDSLGRLFVADYGNNAIRMLTFPPNYSCMMSQSPPPAIVSVPQISPFSKVSVSTVAIDYSNFQGTNGVAVDSSNNVYTVTSSGRVFRITPDKTISIITIIPQATSDVQGLCIKNDQLYISSIGSVFRVDLNTTQYIVFAGTGTAGTAVDGYNTSAVFYRAIGCMFDRFGNLFVADTNGVRKINSTGYVSTIPNVIGCDNGCMGLLFDANDQLLVSDYWNGKISRINLTDYSASTVVVSDPNLSDPNIPGQDSYGNIFAPDYGLASITWINSSNFVTRIAGGINGYSNAGTGRFTSPAQVTVDALGRLLVSERSGHCIRMITWTN